MGIFDSALGSFGLGVVGDLINANINANSAETAKDYQIGMWKMQNEYNLPINQRKRLTDAGFNPNLVYGNGSLSNTAGSVGSPPTPAKKSIEFAQHISNALQSQQLQLAKDNLELNKEKFEQQKYMDYFRQANVQADTLLKGMSTESGNFKLGIDKELRENTLETAYSTLKKLNADIDYLNQNKAQSLSEFNFQKSLRPFSELKAKGDAWKSYYSATSEKQNTNFLRWQTEEQKEKAYKAFVENTNITQLTNLRLKSLIQDYKIAQQANNRSDIDQTLSKMRLLLEQERLKKEEIQAFFQIIQGNESLDIRKSIKSKKK
nr:MAG: DNA pilot protein [Microvirus sp.]